MHRSSPVSGGVFLSEVLSPATFVQGGDIQATSCSGDSRHCRPGDLFVAMVGGDHDGHDHVTEAIERGAKAVVVERLLPVSVPQCIVPNSRVAYGRICQALAEFPAALMQTIGITGTSGKTVTAMLLASILEAEGHRVGVLSSLGYCDSKEARTAGDATPPAPELARWLQRMTNNGCTHAVVEVSSEALARHRLAGIEFDAVAVTNIRRDHLDIHNSIVNYRNAKARIFDHLKDHGFAVLNADDAASRRLLDTLGCPVLTSGVENAAEVSATLVEMHKSEQIFLLTAGHDTVPVRTRMIGEHHVYNCLTAASLALVMGIDLATIVRGLEAVEATPGRLERIEAGQPFGAFVDCARSPDTLRTALQAVRQVTEGRVICVFGSAAEQSSAQRAELGRTAERWSDWTIITSDDPGEQEPLQIAHDILDGFRNPATAHVLPNRRSAIHLALERAEPGDTVLIAGKGQQAYQFIGGQYQPFDDRQVARQWLYETGAEKEYAESPRIFRFPDRWAA